MLSPEKVVKKLAHAKMNFLLPASFDPLVLVMLAGVGLLIGGISLQLGFKTKIAAGLLLLIIIPITLTVQIGNPEGPGPLFKNIGLMGGLIFFLFNGALYYDLDQFMYKSK